MKPWIILTALQIFAAACDADLQVTTDSREAVLLSEELCTSKPDTDGCQQILAELEGDLDFILERLGPINAYPGQVVKLRAQAFDEKIKLTIEGQEIELYRISSAEFFFITPDFASRGMKNSVLTRLDNSIEFKIFSNYSPLLRKIAQFSQT